ncbi:SAM-dependent methyltransferase [Actinomycetospora termitidis]|uniref:SAM-dependent methyltransferase n=1 Tax=Actinomycetospora termitidis TaxID=3053470 RepID=A0ABT7MKI8_9PSEU|nr:SAM-dependent methyltransferase [Actinomycetospora sp. Odt1-22]MDL5159868.1 SAM-dependent methyltransferase [Actinomycetospora sp. Odt1-22]
MSLPREHFDDLWATEQDPWGLESSFYEDRKRALVLAALPDAEYRRAAEPGCAGGALSRLLAPRCRELVCTDVSATAVERARSRVAGFDHVTVEETDAFPPGRFDLVVVSELAYYFDDADRARFWSAVVDALEPGGTLVAVHWIREAPEYPVDGDRVHDELARMEGLGRLAEHREDDFRLDVFARVPPSPRSVAFRVGLR